MSSHFNYEINEAKLRERLNTLEFPANEDAWQSFQTYSVSNPLNQRRNVIPSFQLNINRNLVLPFVFGTVIIGFSFLLFNFVSIKKKPENKITENKPVLTPPPSKPVVKVTKPIIAAVKDSVKPVITETPTVAVKAAEPTPTPAVSAVAKTTASLVLQASSEQYTALSSGNIFISPNKASEVIGSFTAGKGFTPIEETVYFIKITNGNATGYVMKSQLHKKGAAMPVISRKPKKAEVLQSNQTPFMTTSEEKEPELR